MFIEGFFTLLFLFTIFTLNLVAYGQMGDFSN